MNTTTSAQHLGSQTSFAPESELSTAFVEKPQLVGTTYVKNIWYFASPSDRVKRGKTISRQILDDIILIGRDSDGRVFAMQDICPHQGVPLSFGSFDGKCVECPFHGWKFGTDGVCTEIPSLVKDQNVNICKIRTRSYPCVEDRGSIWVYYGEPTETLPDVPRFSGLDGVKYDKSTTTLTVSTHVDYAVVALVDVAHVPYVHKSWWWRSKSQIKEKSKKYVPSGTGWTMVKHSPSKSTIVFKLLGDYMETEICFRLPGIRFEYISLFGRTLVAGMTTCTPVDATHTELNHTSYWMIPYLKPILGPIVDRVAGAFLGQDQAIANKQAVGLKFKPRLTMTIKDVGTPSSWYFQLKREWNTATEEGRAFINPIKEKVLRWKT